MQRTIINKMTMENTREPSFGLDDYCSEVRPPLKVMSVQNLTEGAMHRSGITRGMRVLDLGCGVADVSFRIAKVVGPTGLVVGVDESAEVIDVAKKRAIVAGQCYWTRFAAANLSTFIPHDRFDVVAVRLALLFQSEGDDAVFSQLSACVRPDGVSRQAECANE